MIQPNYYAVLRVSPQATEAEIKARYRELAKQCHPDVVKDKTGAARLFSQISRAYSVLRDPDKRRAYDAGLRPIPAAAPDPKPEPKVGSMAWLFAEAEGDVLAAEGRWAEAALAFRRARGPRRSQSLEEKIWRAEAKAAGHGRREETLIDRWFGWMKRAA